MTPKTIKYVDQERQDNFSCKHENTLKSMEFSESDEQLCLLTVCPWTGQITMAKMVTKPVFQVSDHVCPNQSYKMAYKLEISDVESMKWKQGLGSYYLHTPFKCRIYPKVAQMSQVMRKPTMRFLNRSDTNWSVPSQKMTRSLKFWDFRRRGIVLSV